MMVAVYANARTTISAKKDGEAGWREVCLEFNVDALRVKRLLFDEH